MFYYKFTMWDPIPLEEAKQHKTVKAFEEYENGDKKALKEIHPVLDEPFIKYGGWCFVLRPFLRRYWVKLRGYGINEYYALNKTDIRNRFGSAVLEIIEAKEGKQC